MFYTAHLFDGSHTYPDGNCKILRFHPAFDNAADNLYISNILDPSAITLVAGVPKINIPSILLNLQQDIYERISLCIKAKVKMYLPFLYIFRCMNNISCGLYISIKTKIK